MKNLFLRKTVRKPIALTIVSLAILGLIFGLYLNGNGIFASNNSAVGGGASNAGQGRRQPAHVAGANLAAYYPLDGNATDKAETTGNTLTDTNTVTQATSTPLAADFERDNSEYLEIADNATISTGDIDYTITLWFKLESKPGGGGNMHIINKTSSDGTSAKEFTLAWLGGGTDRLHWWAADGSASTVGAITANTFGAPSLNTWYFVELWHSATDNQVGIRVNNGTADTTATSGAAGESTGPLRIGTQALSPTTEPWSAYFDGAVDGMGFWKKLLTSGERASLYNSGKGLMYHHLTGSLLTNLSAYWDLSESSGTRYNSAGAASTDYTDNNTVTSTAGVTDSLYTGAAGQFTSANSESLTIADSTYLSTGDIDFTLSGWVYFDTQTGEGVLASKQDDTSTREFLLRYDNATDKIVFDVYNASGTSVGSVSTTSTIASKAWYFVVAWHDSVANTVNLTLNNGSTDSAATSGVPTDTAAAFKLGARNSTATAFLDGRLDEVAYWKRTLTSGERSTLYNSGFGVSFANTTALLRRNLVSWWTLDESGGNRSDSILHATNDGAVTAATLTNGKFGQGYSFNGSSTHIAITDSAAIDIGTSQMTVSLWYKSAASTGQHQGLISKETGGSTAGYQIFILSTGDFQACLSKAGPVERFCITTSGTNYIGQNRWRNVVFLRNGTGVYLYLDGVEIGNNTTAGASTADATNSRDLIIGAQPGSDSPSTIFNPSWFNGAIDDVRIYTTALSTAQLSALFGASPPSACDQTCVGWWKLDEASGAVADSSGKGFSGTVTGATYNSEGVFNSALSFDGGDFVTTSNDSALQLTTGTLEAWINTASAGSGYRGIITKQKAYSLFLVDDVLSSFDWGSSTNRSTAIDVTDSVWHHVAMSFQSGTANGTIIYIDGLPKLTTTITVSNQTVGVEIGRGGTSEGGETQLFTGNIDDVRVYNRVLTVAEIASHYLAGKSN